MADHPPTHNPHEGPIPEPFGEAEVAAAMNPYVVYFLALALLFVIGGLLYSMTTHQELGNVFWTVVKFINDLLTSWAV